MESRVSIGNDTYAVIEGLIYRYHERFGQETIYQGKPAQPTGPLEEGYGCHTINCPVHEHWEPV
jgi:hypothetical protein